MKIDLNIIKKEKKPQIDLNFTLNLDTINYYGDKILLPNPVSVVGKLYSLGDNIYLTAEATTDMEVNCSRCLKPFIYHYSSKVSVELIEETSKIDDDSDEDIFYYREGVIDLTDIVKESLIMNIPMQTICNKSCKGICVSCGTNLNNKQCTCTDLIDEVYEDIDPRLAKLKKLLHD